MKWELREYLFAIPGGERKTGGGLVSECGRFAITQVAVGVADSTGEVYEDWRVSDLGTGFSIATGFASYDIAIRFAEAIADQEIDYASFVDDDGAPLADAPTPEPIKRALARFRGMSRWACLPQGEPDQ